MISVIELVAIQLDSETDTATQLHNTNPESVTHIKTQRHYKEYNYVH